MKMPKSVLNLTRKKTERSVKLKMIRNYEAIDRGHQEIENQVNLLLESLIDSVVKTRSLRRSPKEEFPVCD